MEKYVVEGGTRLKGEVIISGAKNAAVAIIPATVLAQGKCVIENIPNISDISVLFKILRSLGAQVRVLDRTTVEIDTTYIGEPVVPYELARYMRASYYLLGALLGRCNRASVSMPGGCNFGVRPIDQHMKGFESLGAKVSIDSGMINTQADLLLGGHIYFDVVSVGATINVMLAAVKAKGITVLENCAKEPHIVDLANCLNSMGADIRGAGTDVIKIHGVDILHGTTYPIIPDQIEAGTYMVAAAATGGDVLVKNVIPKHLEAISQKLEKAGATVIEYDDSIRVIREGALNKVNVKTMPHPGFPTDMQPQMTALLSLAHGTSIVTEGVWDNRFRYVDELRRMGAMIQVDGKVAVVEGTAGLTGAPVRAVDLRAGAAVLIAAMAAKGVTEIENIEHVERGYEDIVGKLSALGANIRKVVIPDHVLKAVL
ncbi:MULTISPECIES: UDP-N-acetylglucosamine 1-carboxyvinyltransferase [unclassified Anaerotruncus]|uniref:UDP-N-acetylglucosamine 1-carboxyvinyltransferase n=1 Tax=unclassified Anaerotruncus TaxID=2641626 RepID=UPI00033EC174|nr:MULTISPECIES: UDP-N-acetylglucosamine 1-carboxyvinyltransferase [unclassified Anaerotruncus]MCI9235007.1 UDP-N-acetylglucosamine 1-carboxyvinyltransferase [Anaerotruncus sp.]NCE74229.1 UDP-N-acetylglucosamine 1-carboxyvinyltransferase [Anaerotruncus sp. X29]RKJ99955.1 UDP-N-acetylglucosamine 1-carboxyvinyltransferase [Anaerotruncus sp. 1XD22-93]EOS59613.1 UDP-N-acetylglucosamine 1-carboxyvinyltransferase [Anaerotruncus sp. G3(2012)]NBK16886.1 UDP-N-acetylglucosamine 1-carboxyvinyltransferas